MMIKEENIILLRNPDDHVKVKRLMENKEEFVAVKFDTVSVATVNVQSQMNAIQNYLNIYGYIVLEYGKDNLGLDKESKGYLYARMEW